MTDQESFEPLGDQIRGFLFGGEPTEYSLPPKERPLKREPADMPPWDAEEAVDNILTYGQRILAAGGDLGDESDVKAYIDPSPETVLALDKVIQEAVPELPAVAEALDYDVDRLNAELVAALYVSTPLDLLRAKDLWTALLKALKVDSDEIDVDTGPPAHEVIQAEANALGEVAKTIVGAWKAEGSLREPRNAPLTSVADSWMATDKASRKLAVLSHLGQQGELFTYPTRESVLVQSKVVVVPPEGVVIGGWHTAALEVIQSLIEAEKAAGRTSGPWTFTTAAIARALYRPAKGTASDVQVRETSNILRDLMRTYMAAGGVNWDGTPYGFDVGDGVPTPRGIEEPALRGGITWWHLPNGTSTTVLEVDKEPLLTRNARELNMLKNMAAGLSSRKGDKTSRTLAGIAVYRELLTKCVNLWHGSRFLGPTHPYQVSYMELAEHVGGEWAPETITAKRRRQLRTYTAKALDELVARGFVTRWEVKQEGRAGKETGVVVFLPEHKPVMEVIESVEPWRDPPALPQ